MRLAFITPLLPTATPDTGFEIANACVLEALKAEGADVTLFGFLRADESLPPPDNAVVLDRIVIENAVAGRTQKLRWVSESLRRGLPVIATKLALYGEDNLLARLREHGPFNAIIINSAAVAGAFPSLTADSPCILVAHNVEHVSAAGNAASGGTLMRLLYRREARLLRAIEHRALMACRFIWCFAEEDRQGFGIDITAKSAVLPLIMPQSSSPAQSMPEDTPPAFDVGLIGTWTWQPNMAGLRWFLEEVAPQLPDDISVAVAGRLPAGHAVRQSTISFLGRVADASAFVASARVMALTSRTGTGIQLKTIETLQAGKPAVATLSSIRGIGALPTNCLVADDAKGFASALTKIVRDVRSGRTTPSDSLAFAEQRRERLQAAVREGLAAIPAR
jgi:glycosyltransferase involved in cell wall biosynthesis